MNPATKLPHRAVVQMSTCDENNPFQACFMTVSETKSWGVIGYLKYPLGDSKFNIAYFRAKWENISFIGMADYLLDEQAVNDELEKREKAE